MNCEMHIMRNCVKIMHNNKQDVCPTQCLNENSSTNCHLDSATAEEKSGQALKLAGTCVIKNLNCKL